MNDNITKSIILCKRLFLLFDEIWFIGPRSDHCDTIIDLSIIKEQDIKVTHIHNQIGRFFTNSHTYYPRKNSSNSFRGIFEEINPSIYHEIDRVIVSDKRVVLIMPSPNKALYDMIRGRNAESKFVVTAPVANPKKYLFFEDKSRLCEIAPEDCLIRSINTRVNADVGDIKRILNLKDSDKLILQQCISAGGSGTFKIGDQQNFNQVLKAIDASEKTVVKVSEEIKDAYPANGSICIVPIDKSHCDVYIDPLSHKVVDTNINSERQYSSLGNDWGVKWSGDVNHEYIRIAKAVGKNLYKKWGCTGIIGLDFLVKNYNNNYHKTCLYLTEINPRWQGTTPYQTYNALLSGRVPLEIAHYIIKLSDNDRDLATLRSILGSPGVYNLNSTNRSGIAYIKLYAPGVTKTIKNNISGCWSVCGGTLRKVEEASLIDAIMDNNVEGKYFIKAPSRGTVVDKEFAAICYIYGVGYNMFNRYRPEVTEFYSLIMGDVEYKLYG